MKNFIVVLSLAALLYSCGGTETENPIIDCEIETTITANEADQVAAVKEFGIDLFQLLTKEGDENVIVSPVSIYSALLLAAEGAGCETKEEILEALSLGGKAGYSTTAESYLGFMNQLRPTEGSTIINYANALFSDPNRIRIDEVYSTVLENSYSAEIYELDFSDTAAAAAINEWAAEKTEKRITKVIDQISANEIAFLLNAIYFIGDWEYGFQLVPDRTITFTLKDNSVTEVPAMSQDGTRKFFSDDEVQLVDMEIKGGEYAVSFISPSNKESDLDSLLQKENFNEYYNSLLDKMNNGRVSLTIPKFELKGNLSLVEVMNELGMQRAFQPGSADFSKMGQANGDIFLTRMTHDTYVKVDEKGIEGAAVTTIGVGINSVPPALTYDRPFAFILRHKGTGVPIFIAKVENPIAE